MNSKDIVFKQFQNDIVNFHKINARMDKLPELSIYRYHLISGENIFTISARLNIPYDTIATLNRLQNPDAIFNKTEILIPNVPGIFVPLNPSSEFEFLMFSWRPSFKFNHEIKKIELNESGIKTKYLFIPDDRFTSTERAFFLGLFFHHPLPKSRITSNFGYRPDPFSGKISFHKGIDLAAPIGTSVFASRNGKVIERKNNSILGNYIIIIHNDGYQTVYGHLNSFTVDLGDFVTSGSTIGTVGTTGQSTGPHLHFEIRRDGNAKDPLPHFLRY